MAVLRAKKKAAEKTVALRAKLWPGLDKSLLWDAKVDDGYTPVPRAMPLIMAIIDDMTKGKPAGYVFFELWCRAFNEMYVSLGAATSLATHAGYSGQRAVRMLHERIESLEANGFIITAPGSAGKLSHAVILNPYKVIKEHYEKGHQGITPEKYAALVERADDIGATDFKSDTPPLV
jgi:hypothetical protein